MARLCSFSVVAGTVTGVTNYQWYNNGVAIANATNASLTLNPTVAANYSSAFSVVVDHDSIRLVQRHAGDAEHAEAGSVEADRHTQRRARR